MDEEEIGALVMDAAMSIHRRIGSGLLESAYQKIMGMDLVKRGLEIQNEVPVDILYEGMEVPCAFRADIIVNEKVILELKSVEHVSDAHKKQLLTYLKLADMRLGYILNFGASLMKKGVFRIVNGLINKPSLRS